MPTPYTCPIFEGRCTACGWLIFRDRRYRVLVRHAKAKKCPRCRHTGKARIFKCQHTQRFAERIDPRKFHFNPAFAAIVGAIIGHDYGTGGGRLTGISITPDGQLIAGCPDEGVDGALIGEASDLDGSLARYRDYLRSVDRLAFDELYLANVIDYRGARVQ